MVPESNLSRLVRPKSVAIVGASATSSTPGHNAFQNLAHHSELEGNLFLVNPRRNEIEGYPCLPDVESLPLGIDTALILVSAEGVVDAVTACGRRGIKFAIVPTGGLAEMGQEGRIVEQQLYRAAVKHDIRVYGTNCPGLTNVNDKILLSVSPDAHHDTLGGNVGLITHGGGPGRNIMQYMDRGLGIGCWLSAGNEVDLSIVDFVSYLTQDPRTGVIACIVEGLKDGAGFLAAAATAVRLGKPVLVLLVGRSERGAEAAQTHTAHLASPVRVMRAAMEQNGIIVVDDIDELAEQASLFGRVQSRAEVSPCIVSFSGGAAIAAVDALHEVGIETPRFSKEVADSLAEVLPRFASPTNPLDVTLGLFSKPKLLDDALQVLSRESVMNTLVVPVPADYGEITEMFARKILTFVSEHQDLLLAPAWTSPRLGVGYRVFTQEGILPFSTLTGLAKGLRNLEKFTAWRATPRSIEAAPEAGVGDSDAGFVRRHDEWSESSAKSLISHYGIAIPTGRVVSTQDQAVEAAHRIGLPIVLKVHSSEIAHKSDVGGVFVGLQSADDIRGAWSAMDRSVREAGYRSGVREGLVEAVAPDGIDILLSIRRDEVFGHVVTVGLGGIFAEVLDDVGFAVDGVSDDGLEHLLRSLVAWPVLDGYRSTPRVNRAELIEIVRSLQRILREIPSIDELEINPLRLFPGGPGPLALDVLIRARDA